MLNKKCSFSLTEALQKNPGKRPKKLTNPKVPRSLKKLSPVDPSRTVCPFVTVPRFCTSQTGLRYSVFLRNLPTNTTVFLCGKQILARVIKSKKKIGGYHEFSRDNRA